MQPVCADAANDLMAVLTTPHVPEIRRTLAQVRPELAEDSLAFRAAVLLMVGPAASFNIDRMAGRTQIPRHVVAACTRRLFDNGVWQPEGALYAWRSPDDHQFWFDVSVAEGQLCRRTDPLGRIEWAAPGEWRKHYEFGETNRTSLSVAYVTDSAVPAEPEEMPPPSIEPAQEAAPVEAAAPEVERPARPDAERKVRRRRAPIPLGSPPAAPPSWLGVVPREELFSDVAWLK